MLQCLFCLITVKERVENKTKYVLHFVSICKTHSERESYVQILKELINVTVIGHCGIRNCSKTCEQEAIDKHLFYLSFENSVCTDYITEKLFTRLGEFLPVVLKRSLYRGLLPDKAIIAADDFKSPKELADYLKYLYANRTALMEHFEWIESYGWGETAECRLCALLHEKNRQVKIISDVTDWWFGGAECLPGFAATLF